MYHRFHVTLSSLILAFVLTADFAQGATSYLLIQGDFDTASAGIETYKWKVVYTSSLQISGFAPSDQNTGLALLAAIFGNGISDPDDIYGGATNQVDTGGGFVNSITLGGVLVDSAPDYWGYLNANGGNWLAASTGMVGRQLADGSYDAWTNGAWVYAGTDPIWGDLYDPHPVEGSGNSPSSGNFSGIETLLYTYSPGDPTKDFSVYSIASAPEPSRSILLLLAGIALVTRRRRTFSSSC